MRINKSTFKLLLPILAILSFYLLGPFAVYTPKLRVILLLFIILFASFLGYKIGRSFGSQYRRKNLNSDKVIISYTNYTASLIFISSSYYVYWLLNSGLGIEILLNNLSSVRGSLIERDITMKLASVFAFQCFPLVILLTYHRNDTFKKSVKYLLIASFILMGFASILQAGRTFFLFTFVIIYSIYIVYKKDQRKTFFSSIFKKLIVFLLLLFGLVIIVYIQLNRPSAAAIQEISQTAEFSYGGKFIENYLGRTFQYLLISFYGYTTAPFNNFLILADVSTRLTDDNHTIVDYFLCKLSICQNISNNIDSYSLSTYKSYVANGGQQTGWGTALSVWMNMYGLMGVILFSFVLSFLYGIYLMRFQCDKSVMNYFNLMFVYYLIINSIFEFPIDSIFFAFIMIKVYVVLFRTLIRKKG